MKTDNPLAVVLFGTVFWTALFLFGVHLLLSVRRENAPAGRVGKSGDGNILEFRRRC